VMLSVASPMVPKICITGFVVTTTFNYTAAAQQTKTFDDDKPQTSELNNLLRAGC
jgi:hypothetical protein